MFNFRLSSLSTIRTIFVISNLFGQVQELSILLFTTGIICRSRSPILRLELFPQEALEKPPGKIGRRIPRMSLTTIAVAFGLQEVANPIT
ncbi:hypothetical protein Mapa_013868 [Marchantia paleacea]|nr:hypothetical protein Mapa_013868 [Marchantia paleacea]